MVHLTQASHELFSRDPDERFDSLESLAAHCEKVKTSATEVWRSPRELFATSANDKLMLATTPPESQAFELCDWSFSQLCRQANVAKDTVNRLSAQTATAVFAETFAMSDRPLQLYTTPARTEAAKPQVKSLHAASYTRLYNFEVLEVVRQFASEFQPPSVGVNGGTGLYCGEQDMFCFLIDPDGWIDIKGEQFAPGFFVWNSEVGRRSLGMTSFWFQRVCGNHIVWDATDVSTFSRKHTANVHEGLREIYQMIEQLVTRRDERKDAFSRMIGEAMSMKLGNDAEDAVAALVNHGMNRKLATEAVADTRLAGGFSVFAVVDALTRRSQQLQFAGARAESDQQAARLLALAT